MPRLQATVTTTTVQQVKLTPTQQLKLKNAFTVYQKQKAIRDEADAKMVQARVESEEVMEDAGQASLSLDGFKTTLVAPVKKGKFSLTLAVKQGLPLAKLQKSYEPDEPGTPYAKISVPGETVKKEAK